MFQYKNYQLRKMAYMRFLKQSIEMKCEESVLQYNNYYKNSIKFEREMLKYKLRKLLNNDLVEIDKNFDSTLKDYIQLVETHNKPIIKGDISYNIAVIIYMLI